MSKDEPVELKNIAMHVPDTKNGGLDNPAFTSSPQNDTNINIDNNSPDGIRHRASNGPGLKDDFDTDKPFKSAIPEDDSDLSPCMRGINKAQKCVIDFYVTHEKAIIRVILIVILLLYLAYVCYALSVKFGDEGSIRLLVGTCFGIFLLVLHLTWEYITRGCSKIKPDVSESRAKSIRRGIRWLLYIVSVVTMVTLLIVLVALETPKNLISLAGLAAFIILSWIFSINPARVNWHPVFWGFSLQFYFAVVILKTKWGYEAFKWLGDRVTEFLAYSNDGAAFVFGENFTVHFFAFAILPVIVFFSAVISVLYYLGVMQAIVQVIGRFLAFCMGTTPAESLNAAGNIFVGMTEAPLMIRPFIGRLTKSEIHAIMTGGFATIAGSVLGAYIGFGIPANHLLSASVMSAPAALAISKLTYPETEEPQIQDDDYAKLEKGAERNLIEAASAGASGSIALVANVAVNVMAFLSILKFVNATLTWFGDRAGVKDLTFQLICSYVLYPISLFMGTELGPDCRRIGQLVGVKTFTNEFIAYGNLTTLLHNRQHYLNYTNYFNVSEPGNIAYNDLDVNLTQWNMNLKGGFLSPRSEVIATYALCGFSNFGSMGIMLGGLSAMAPHRRTDMAAVVFRAMIAGNIACFFTACIAGLFYEEEFD